MVKSGALVMGVVMGAVSAATYYGLEMLPPGTIPPPIGRVVVAAETAAAAPAEPAPVVAAAPVEAAAAPAAAPEPDVTEQDLAEEPPPQAAPVPDEPDSAPAAAAPTPAPAPVEQPVEKPAAEVAEKPAAAEPAPATAPAPAPTRKAEAAPIKPWWPDPATLPDTQLKLMYAGQVKGQPAIALLFSAPVNLDSVKANVRIATSSGTAVGGGWEVGKNPRLAVFKSVAPGRYTVILRPQVTDAQGVALGTLLSGPVDIKGP